MSPASPKSLLGVLFYNTRSLIFCSTPIFHYLCSRKFNFPYENVIRRRTGTTP